MLALKRRRPEVIAAMEEVLLESASAGQNTIVFHEWMPAFSISKGQAVSDIDVRACSAAGIPVVRTLVGGRAVYHDHNYSLSFCVAMSAASIPPPTFNNNHELYSFLIEKVVRGLRACDVPAELKETNYIRVDEKKVSGNAMKKDKDAVVLHGSLLYDIPDMHEYAMRMLEFVNTHGESKEQWREDLAALLTSITAHNPSLSRQQVCEHIGAAFTQGQHQEATLTSAEQERIEYLARTKYSNPSWHNGASTRGLCWRKYGESPTITRGENP